jgi:molybdate transport system substrate-binding protein
MNGMLIFYRCLALVALYSLLGIASASAQRPVEPPLIFAAASTKDALDEIAKQFEVSTGTKVRISYAGSNVLASQIANGAPASIFLSADEPWMNFIEEKGLIVNASRRNLLRNELVLIAPSTSKLDATSITRDFPITQALGGGRLAIANPDTVPAGKYARAALQYFNLWQSVEPRLARAENVRSALVFVARAEAPLGIVYRTDALAEPKVKIVAAFPSMSHPNIVYPVALLRGRDNETGRKFLDFLREDRSKAIWKKFGFEFSASHR